METFASGTAIAAHARALGWMAPRGGVSDAAAVAEAARGGDERARAAFGRAAQALAAAIAATAALVELERVVVGGGVAQAGEVLFAPLRRRLADYAVLDFVRDLPVVPAALALDAGLVGAAAAAAGARAAAPYPPFASDPRRIAVCGEPLELNRFCEVEPPSSAHSSPSP